jgi:uncharacterized protein
MDRAGASMSGARKRAIWLGAAVLGAIALVALVGCGGSSQATATEPTQAQTLQLADTVTVSGTGDVLAQPDQAVINVGVNTQAATAAEAMDGNSKAMAGVIQALKSAGVQDSMIQTSSVSVVPNINYDPTTGEQKLNGYQAQNTVRVTLKDLSMVGAVYAAATGAGANNVTGPEWTLSDQNDATKQALDKAVAAARNKADALAAAVGRKVGDVVVINESGTVVPPVYADMAQSAGGKVATPPVNPMDIQVSANVTITYRLVQ